MINHYSFITNESKMKKMKKVLFMALLLGNCAYAQMKEVAMVAKLPNEKQDLKMTSKYGPSDAELLEWMRFENIDYYKINFTGAELKSKRYKITVKEIWNGKITRDTIVFNSKELESMGLDKVNDTTLSLKVMGKQTSNNKLRLSFVFPRFSITKEYKALANPDYSLRNLAEESKIDIGYGKQFYFMAYILPYQRPDGSKSWCDVGGSGKDIENWGKKFGVKHYLLFELKFE
jgi:hypothetical protein